MGRRSLLVRGTANSHGKAVGGRGRVLLLGPSKQQGPLMGAWRREGARHRAEARWQIAWPVG